MVKFKLKGYIRQELDEVVVEARDREEAEEKYNEMFVKQINNNWVCQVVLDV